MKVVDEFEEDQIIGYIDYTHFISKRSDSTENDVTNEDTTSKDNSKSSNIHDDTSPRSEKSGFAKNNSDILVKRSH